MIEHILVTDDNVIVKTIEDKEIYIFKLINGSGFGIELNINIVNEYL